MSADPTVRSQELGDELRALREAHCSTLSEAAKLIDASISKLSRIESGLVTASAEDVSGLLVIYGVTGAKRRELLALAREADRRGWWQRNRPNFPERQRTLIALETKAEQIVNFETVVIPGLLQTAEYTRAIMTGCGYVPDGEIEDRMDIRFRRHSVLTQQHAPNLLAIIDEPVLHRAVGGVDVLRRQLEHLVNAASRRHVEIRIIPRTIPDHAGIDGSFTLIRRPGCFPVVFLENLTSSLFLEEREEIDKYESALRDLFRSALDARQSLEVLADLARLSDTEASAR